LDQVHHPLWELDYYQQAQDNAEQVQVLTQEEFLEIFMVLKEIMLGPDKLIVVEAEAEAAVQQSLTLIINQVNLVHSAVTVGQEEL
jgi:hypothetical protein